MLRLEVTQATDESSALTSPKQYWEKTLRKTNDSTELSGISIFGVNRSNVNFYLKFTYFPQIVTGIAASF
jgi:hypothetical protein